MTSTLSDIFSANLFSSNSVNIIAPAFFAGVLVLLSHVPLGRQVLQRGIIFIDLAVAQAAATGVLLATMFIDVDHGLPSAFHLGFIPENIIQQFCAASAALIMVIGLHHIEKRWPRIQEALIGGSFVLLASFAIVISAKDPHGGEHIHDLMAGQILWASNDQLIWLAAATATSLILARLFSSPLLSFYIPLAIAVTASVQVVGVYLVFACLIFPALVARELKGCRATLIAMITGITGFILGLSLSIAFDLPSGPSIVLSLALCSLLGAAFRAQLSTHNSGASE